MDSLFELDSMDIFNNVCEDLLNNIYNSKEVSAPGVEHNKMQAAKEEVKKIIYNTNFETSAIGEQLRNKGWDEHKVDCFISHLDKKKSELLYTSLIHHNSSYGESVVNFDWLLKIVFGINELKTLNYPLLQLFFSTITSSGEQKQRVYDINQDILAKLISILESIENIE